MNEEKKYVNPPKNSGEKTMGKMFQNLRKIIKGHYAHLHPDYWKRKLMHILIVLPCVFLIYGVLIASQLVHIREGTFVFHAVSIVSLFLIVGLTVLSVYFYPFSLYWYKQSLIGNILNNIIHIGGFWAVIGKVLATLVGGIIIAGVMAPIMGPLTLRKCKKKGLVIGDASDF